MTKWTDKIENSKAGGEGITGSFSTETGEWKMQQDITKFLEQAKRERDLYEDTKYEKKDPNNHYRKLATIPDIIVTEIKQKHGLDILSPEFGKDPAMSAKLRLIIINHYPQLLSSTT